MDRLSGEGYDDFGEISPAAGHAYPCVKSLLNVDTLSTGIEALVDEYAASPDGRSFDERLRPIINAVDVAHST
jgi:hypothetical protein